MTSLSNTFILSKDRNNGNIKRLYGVNKVTEIENEDENENADSSIEISDYGSALYSNFNNFDQIMVIPNEIELEIL